MDANVEAGDLVSICDGGEPGGGDIEEEEVRHDENVEPFVGMEFSSVVEAQQFYTAYGCRLGFGVRINTNTKRKDGLSSVRMVCSKEGFSIRHKQEEMRMVSDGNLGTPQKEKSNKRSGCMAYIRFKRLNNGAWKVSAFNAKHNHDLVDSPAKKIISRSLNGMTQEEKLLVSEIRAQNVSALEILHYLAEKADGIHKPCSKKKDVSDVIPEENRRLVGVDVETTLVYFRKKQEEDPEFFFAVETDDDGVAINILWVDGRARRAYVEFGDVVTFDMTHNTNKDCMPLGVFIGVNHHGQNIIFGCCLLRNEQATNFNWLFRTWMQAMYNKAPISIITDQNLTMRAAIQEVFPKAVHRCCQWHAMRKAREQLLVYYDTKDGFENEFCDVINRSLTMADFESSWKKMLQKYELEDNSHLNTMYKKREEWVPASFRGTFFGNLSTTEISEGMNAVMKLLVDNHTSIYRFVLQLEKLVEEIWQKESDEDCRTINGTPQLWSRNNMEVDARRVYTRNIFSMFKEILKESTNGVVVEVERDRLYQVDITCHPLVPNWVPETHRVWIDRTDDTISCSCKGYEFIGLLCAHAIKVMQHVGIESLPCRYIVKRWTKGANENAKSGELYIVGMENLMGPRKSGEVETMRYATLYPKLVELVKLASKSGEAYKYVDGKLDEMKAIILLMMTSKGVGAYDPPRAGEVEAGVTTSSQITHAVISSQEKTSQAEEYDGPPLLQCKGRKRKLR
ncbi:protein FAR1-RELATED SEQUENCE 5-like [Carex rostrata]